MPVLNLHDFSIFYYFKVNLHSIRFSYVFVRFFTFLLLLKKYALFHPHFYKSISALSRLLHIDKNFVQKFWVWTIRAIFRNKTVPVYKKFFRKTFVQYVTVRLVRIWTHKNADEKAHTLSRRSKNVKKRTKTYEKRILCKFTFSLYCWGGVFNFETSGIPILYVELRCERPFSESYVAVCFVDVTKFACESLEF